MIFQETLPRTCPPVDEWGGESVVGIAILDVAKIIEAPKLGSRKRIDTGGIGKRVWRFGTRDRQIAFERQKRLQPHLPRGHVKPGVEHELIPVADVDGCHISGAADADGLVLDEALGMIHLTFRRRDVGVRRDVDCSVEGCRADVRDALGPSWILGAMLVHAE